MKDEEIEPLDPSLAALFAEERERAGAPEGSRERVYQRVALSLGAGGGGGEGGAGDEGGGPGAGGEAGALGSAIAGSRLAPLLAAFLLGGGVGGAIVASAAPPRIVYVDRASPVAEADAKEPAVSLAVDGGAAAETDAAPSAAATGARPGAPAGASSAAATRDANLAAERAILDVARTALGRSDAAHALEAVDRHAREFPGGQLSEEREAIAVQALVKLRRREDAAARGARFRKRYPNSVLIPVIDAALATTAPSPASRP